MQDLLTALALILVIEGVLYALMPESMQNFMQKAMQLKPNVLRNSGLVIAFTGFLIVLVLRRVV